MEACACERPMNCQVLLKWRVAGHHVLPLVVVSTHLAKAGRCVSTENRMIYAYFCTAASRRIHTTRPRPPSAYDRLGPFGACSFFGSDALTGLLLRNILNTEVSLY